MEKMNACLNAFCCRGRFAISFLNAMSRYQIRFRLRLSKLLSCPFVKHYIIVSSRMWSWTRSQKIMIPLFLAESKQIYENFKYKYK